MTEDLKTLEYFNNYEYSENLINEISKRHRSMKNEEREPCSACIDESRKKLLEDLRQKVKKWIKELREIQKNCNNEMVKKELNGRIMMFIDFFNIKEEDIK